MYGIVAIVWIIVFVIPVPLFLMFTPYCKNKLARKLLPYFNALQGCFKDEYRWFSAFYFLCRLVLLLFATFVPRGPVKRCLLQAACIVFLWVFLYLKPYVGEGCESPCEDDEDEDEGKSNRRRGRRNRCQLNTCCCCMESYDESQEGGQQRRDDVESKGNRCKKRKCRFKLHGGDQDFGWVNTSDALLLVNLCLIAVISSQITDNMKQQTQKAMTAAVNTLAYVPLVVLVYSVMRAISKKYWESTNATPKTKELNVPVQAAEVDVELHSETIG